MTIKQFKNSTLIAVVANILTAYSAYFICRVAYLWENWNTLAGDWEGLDKWLVFCGGLRFDTSAICYTNAIYCLLMFVPLAVRRKDWWQGMCRGLYVVVNLIAIVANLADTVYSQYTGRRTTATFFSEFQNEGNLGTIIGVELLNHWYLVVLGIALSALLWFCYRRPRFEVSLENLTFKRKILHCIHSTLLFFAVIPISIIGIRGGASTAVRPIAMSNAMQYVNEPSQAALVLNTPFTFIRTLGKKTFEVPDYFDDADDAERKSGYSSVHPACERNGVLRDDSVNVVILILESFGQEYIGAYNNYTGYTPFLDSLIGESMAFRNAYSNGRKSIDAMPSILSSIPMFVEPFVVTPYGLNEVRSIASELGVQGYHCAFFHGAENGSMGFEAFARAAGYDAYFGRKEYDEDTRFGGEKDFDGTWAIWDEEFLQFYALKMSDLEEPFVTTLFTASSHHPFVVPQRYEQSLATTGHPMYRCVRYVDQALRKFFATCQQQPWYGHTIFVITADHTNVSERPEYQTPLGPYRVPIIIYDPSGQLPTGWQQQVAQQIDIMPTLLGLLGAKRPYIAYGKDLLEERNASWAVNYNNGIYQYVDGERLLQYDGNQVVGGETITSDEERVALQKLQGILYDYMRRMTDNELVVRTPSSHPTK